MPKNDKAKRTPPDALQRETGHARRGKIYELFVLGELTAGPHHGYLLREILGKVLGPFRQVSWGALYPLLHRLEQDGLVMHDVPKAKTAGQGKEEQRTLYRITGAGRKRFCALMSESVPYKAYDSDLFLAKLGYFDHIPLSEQQAILQHHRGYLQESLDFIQTNLDGVMQIDEIPTEERTRIAWVTEFRLRRLRTEQAWVDEALAKGTL